MPHFCNVVFFRLLLHINFRRFMFYIKCQSFNVNMWHKPFLHAWKWKICIQAKDVYSTVVSNRHLKKKLDHLQDFFIAKNKKWSNFFFKCRLEATVLLHWQTFLEKKKHAWIFMKRKNSIEKWDFGYFLSFNSKAFKQTSWYTMPSVHLSDLDGVYGIYLQSFVMELLKLVYIKLYSWVWREHCIFFHE